MSQAAVRMPAPQPFLVYRDRIGAPSEIGFLRRQYLGFSRLHPVWCGRTVLAGAGEISSDVVRLGGDSVLGPWHRLLFRHFGVVPPFTRHGPACPGHLSRHGAATGCPDKPGHDGWAS